jgi:hypothetical protein
MATARCKFQVQEVTHFGYGGRRVKLSTAYDEKLSKEDAAFCKATPSGEMTVTIDNPNVFDTFKPGAYVYVDVISIDGAA